MSVRAGANKYCSAQSYALKRMEYILHKVPTNEDMERGIRMEPAILEAICSSENLIYINSPLITGTLNPRDGATADGLAYHAESGELFILEAKCPRYIPKHPPIQYIIQVQRQLKVWRDFFEELLPEEDRPTLRCAYLVCIEEDMVQHVAWKISWSQEFYNWVEGLAATTSAYISNGYSVPENVCPYIAYDCTDDIASGSWRRFPFVKMEKVEWAQQPASSE